MSADTNHSTWATSIIQKLIQQPSAEFDRIRLTVGHARALLKHKPAELSQSKFGALIRNLHPELDISANVADDKAIFTSVRDNIAHLEDGAPYPFPGIDIFVCTSHHCILM